MEVYIEYAIIDNFAFDYLLFYCVNKTLKLKKGVWHITLCSLLGVAFALSLPLLKLNGILLFLVKSVVGVSLCLLFTLKRSKLLKIYSILLFFAYTFVLGGVLLALIYAVGDFSFGSATLNYSSNIPIGIYLVAIAIFTYLVYSVTTYINKARHQAKFKYSVSLVVFGKTYSVDAFLDSGNSLTYLGRAVCFVFCKYLCKSIGKQIAEQISCGNKVLEKITYSTVSGQKTSYAVLATINKQENYIILSKRNSEHDIILNLLGGNYETT
ncbi:MAG: sigma-E processing peptidase SpoIIGA [Clostridia bacterium]